MEYSVKTEQYIFNALNKYSYSLKQYKEDALQEIRIAIVLAEDEKDAMHIAGRLCYKLLKEFGCSREFLSLDKPYEDSGKTKEYADDSNDSGSSSDIIDDRNDNGNDVIKRAIIIYKKVKDAKETCWHLGINYTKELDKILYEASYE